jgi:hypothetical protein
VLARQRFGGSLRVMLAYTSSGPWRGRSAALLNGVIEFDDMAAGALNQRAFHIDLRCLARVPIDKAWFPDLEASSGGVVAIAGARLQNRILRLTEHLATRSPESIEIRGL